MSAMNNKYHEIIKHYENCLEQYGDTHKGVDWPNQEDMYKRYQVMLEVIKDDSQSCKLLDFGCGTALMYGYIIEENYAGIEYAGLDISEKFVAVAREKHPEITFYVEDVLRKNIDIPNFDYIIMNGVFTEKRELTYEEMLLYFQEMIKVNYEKSTKGIAFNVMSKAVDWERDDLFHLSTDVLIDFLIKNLSRNFVIRNDYGLYEYTVYVYK